MAAGRNYESRSEYGNVLINEEAARRFGFNNPDDAVGAKISFSYEWKGINTPSTVIGVIRNFYQRSPKEAHIPMVFAYDPYGRYFATRLESNDITGTVEKLKDTWSKLFPSEPFTYFFADDRFDQQYRADVQFGEVMATFSMLAVIIACLGLFGLSSYTILQRRKEIGIRKVLGASITQVVQLLSGSYVKIILISSLVAIPAAWFTIDNWLSGYAIRIELSAWMFVVPVVLILALALITVSFQTVRSAMVNPAETLNNNQ